MMIWFIAAISALWFYATLLFFIAEWRKDYSIADIGWAGGFILLAIVSLMKCAQTSVRSWIVSCAVLIWGVRLTLHLMVRHQGEDSRYTQWRALWGTHIKLKAYVYVFIIQAALMFIIMSPVWLINITYRQSSLNVFDYVGLLLWTVGFMYELIGDWQLQIFLSRPENRGRIMRYGLWRHTRHPNYFGEVLVWWGLWLCALNVSYGWLTIISPLIVMVLLLYVSGIPLVEKQFVDHVEYQEYKRTTSAFFPWFNATL